MNYATTSTILQQFKDKYPTCYEAVYQLKGGKWYSQDYKNFPAIMTEFESEVIWETNKELIAKGFDVVNIFDSLLSDSDDAIAQAKQLVLEKFAAFGIKPILKDINYGKAQAKSIEPTQHTEQQKEPKKQTANTFKNENMMNDTKAPVLDMYNRQMTEADIEAREKSFLQKAYLQKNANKMFHYSMSDMLDMFEDEYAAQKKAQKNAKLKKEKAAK